MVVRLCDPMNTNDHIQAPGYVYVLAAFVGYICMIVAFLTSDAVSQYFAVEDWLQVFPYGVFPLLMMFCFLFFGKFGLGLPRGRRTVHLLKVSITAYASLLCVLVAAAILFWAGWCYLAMTLFHNGVITSDMA